MRIRENKFEVFLNFNRQTLIGLTIIFLFIIINFNRCYELKKSRSCGINIEYSLLQEDDDFDFSKIKSLKMKRIIYATDGSGLTYLKMIVMINQTLELERKAFRLLYSSNEYSLQTFEFNDDEYIKNIMIYYDSQWLTAIKILTNRRESPIIGDLLEDAQITEEKLELNSDLVGFSVNVYQIGFSAIKFHSVLNCLEKCETCVSNNPEICLTCSNSNRYFALIDDINLLNSDYLNCIKAPLEGYFLKENEEKNNQIYLFPCDVSCKNCLNFKESCTQCSKDYFQIENPGVCSKEAFKGYYIDSFVELKQLKKCNEACAECLQAGKTMCTKCNNNYFSFKKDEFNPVKECFTSQEVSLMNNYFINPENNLIEECDDKCLDGCTGNKKLCKNCKDNFYKKYTFNPYAISFETNLIKISDECFDSNQPGFFLDFMSKPKILKSCDKSCITCIFRAAYCVTCAKDYYFTQGLSKVCLKNALSGFYLDENNPQNIVYKPCAASCKSCGINADLCYDCSDNYFYKIDFFENEDDLKILLNINLILPARCYNSNPSSNYFLSAELKAYIKCSENCALCSEYGKDKCTKCVDNTFFSIDKVGYSGKCYSVAPAKNYFLDKSDYLYKECHERCSACVGGDINSCTECSNGFYPKEPFEEKNFTCYADLSELLPKENYFFRNSKFYLCHVSCRKCIDELDTSCLACSDNYYFAESSPDQETLTKKCYLATDRPPGSYFLDSKAKLFLQCDRSCASCNTNLEDECTSCNVSSNFYFKETEDIYSEKNYVAVYDSKGFDPIKIDNDKNLAILILEISNYTYDNLKPAKGYCYDANKFSENYYFLDFNINIFRKCTPNCKTCNSLSYKKCLSCNSGYKFKIDYQQINDFICYKVDSLPVNYYNDSNLDYLVKCATNCKKCLNDSFQKCYICEDNFYFKKDEFVLNSNNQIIKHENFNAKECFQSLDKSGYVLSNDLWTVPDGFYLDQKLNSIDGVYKPCDISCIECVDDAKNCLICNKALNYFNKSDAKMPSGCYNTVPLGYYLVTNTLNNSNISMYYPCDKSCKSCMLKSDFCIICNTDNNYYPLFDEISKCVDEVSAPQGYIIESSNNISQKRYVKSSYFKLNNFNNINIKNITPAYAGRYTLEFWFYNTAANLKAGLHIVWKNLISITLIQESSVEGSNVNNLNVYCFPQDYKVQNKNNLFDSNIYKFIETTTFYKAFVYNYNKKLVTYYSNNWIFIRCAADLNSNLSYILHGMSYDNNEDHATSFPIKNDLISKENYNEFSSKYFWQNGERSEFSILGANKNLSSNIYIRTLGLYSEYLPSDYSFRNYDLNELGPNKISFLSAYINFDYFDAVKNEIIFISDETIGKFNVIPASEKSTTNFIIPGMQKLCKLSNKEKYQNNGCFSFNDCDNTKYEFCFDNNLGAICQNNYIYDPNNAVPNCYDNCSYNFYRSPGNDIDGFCNSECDPDLQKCKSSSYNIMQNIDYNFECKSGNFRYNYKCIDLDVAEKSYFNFNGCLNTPNFTIDYNLQNYVISFWIKLDRQNEFCFPTNTGDPTSLDYTSKYYFIAYPHALTYDLTAVPSATDKVNLGYKIYYQQLNNTSNKVVISNFSQYNWNHVSLEFNSLSKTFRVIINYNYFTPELLIENVAIPSNFFFTKLIFCSNIINCNIFPLQYLQSPGEKFIWGAAFYRNLSIHDSLASSFLVIQELNYYRQTTSLTANIIYDLYIKSQISEYYLTLESYSRNGFYENVQKISNLKILNSQAYANSPYFVDNLDLFYFGSKTDILENAKLVGKFISLIDSTTLEFTTSSCMANCNKCSDSSKDCLECSENYKLLSNKCVLPTNKYLAFPPKWIVNNNNPNYNQNYLAMNLDNLNMNKLNALTITMWIKYMNPVYNSNSECVKILRLSRDNKSYVCHNIKDNSIKLFNKDNLAFSYNTANKIFGIWTFVSISYYHNFNNDLSTIMNNNQNKYFNSNMYFSNRFNFYINDESVQMDSKFYISPFNDLIKIDNNLNAPYSIAYDCIEIGNEFFGYLSEIKIYNNFIFNPFSIINNNGINSRNNNFQALKIFNFKTFTNNVIDFASLNNSGGQLIECLKDSDVNLSLYPANIQNANNYILKTLGLDCKLDFNPYESRNFSCLTKTTFANYKAFGKNSLELSCQNCSNNRCLNGCSSEQLDSCLCDFASANNFFYIDFASKAIKCENLLQFEFSQFSKIMIPNISVSQNNQYSIEFMFYLYTYNYDGSNKDYIIPFSSIEIIWDLHLKITIENVNNTLYYTCFPLFDSDATNTTYQNLAKINSQKVKIEKPLINWIYISCSVNVKSLEFYTANIKNKITLTSDSKLIDFTKLKSTNLIIQPGVNASTNFGLLFIKELKLWSLYDIYKFTTNCDPNLKTLASFLLNNNSASNTYFKELLHYFKIQQKAETLAGINENSFIDSISGTKFTITDNIKRKDFIGYNIINTAINMDKNLNFPSLDLCAFLSITPTSGIVNVTQFTIKLNSYAISASAINMKFYYKKEGSETKTVINSDGNSLSITTIISDAAIDAASSENPFNIEIYCEFNYSNNASGLYTAFNKLNIYSSKSELGNTQIVGNLISAIPVIHDDISDEEIDDALEILDKLEEYEMLENSSQSNSTTNANNSTSINNKSVQSDSAQLKSPICKADSCNKRGICKELLSSISCKCDDTYYGFNCEISSETAMIIKNVTLGIVDSLNKKIMNAIEKKDSNSITPSLLNNIGKQIENGIKVFESVAELTKFKKILNTLLDPSTAFSGNSASGNSISEKVAQNSNMFVNSINNLLDFNTQQIGKTQINNNQEYNKRISSNAANSILNNIEIQNNLNGDTDADKRVILIENKNYDKYNAEAHKNIIYKSFIQLDAKKNARNKKTVNNDSYRTNYNIFSNNYTINSLSENPRLLQASNSSNLANTSKANDYYLLDELQKIEFFTNYNDLKKLIISLSQNIVKGFINKKSSSANKTSTNSTNITDPSTSWMNSKLLDYYQSNLNFDLFIKQISDINSEAKIETLFESRIKNKQSYVDAYDCMKNYMNKSHNSISNLINDTLSKTDIFILYVIFKNPIFIIDQQKSNNSLSLSYYFALLNSKGEFIDISSSCNADIIHYIPLQTKNSDFISKYRLFPKKYYLDYYNTDSNVNNITRINHSLKKKYDKYKIFSDGSVDRNSSINYQLNKYYTQYRVNLFYLNANATISNNIYINDNTEANYVKTFNDNDYIVTYTRMIGEISIFAEYNPPIEYTGNSFYLFNNILFTKDNLANNTLFKILLIFICLNYFFVIFLLLHSWLCKSEEANSEESILEKESRNCHFDNDVLGDIQNRYSLYGYLDYSSHMTSKLNNKNNQHFKLANNNSIPENSNVEGGKKKDFSDDNVKLNINYEIRKHKETYSASVKGGNTPSFYAFYHFFVKRNIYANFILNSSVFTPKYKLLIKMFCLFFLHLSISSLLFITCSWIDFNKEVYIDISRLASITIVTNLASNFVFTVINIFYSCFMHNDLITSIISSGFNKEIRFKLDIYNYIKCSFLILFNTGLFGLCMYFCFLFNVIWTEWITQLIIIWIFVLISDFIIFEVFFEVFIILLLRCGENNGWLITIRKFFFMLKNLRNHF